MWRQEISDKLTTLKGQPYKDVIMGAYDRGVLKTGDQLYKTTVDDVFFHHGLKEAYPEVMNIETQMMRKGSDAKGSLSTGGKNQVLQVREDLLAEPARSTILHELQHAIQEKEGFGVGGNTDTMDRMIGKVKDRAFLIKQTDEYKVAEQELNKLADDFFTNKINKTDFEAGEQALLQKYPVMNEYRDAYDVVQHFGNDPSDAYRRLMGEAEARLTQTRRNLSPEERKQYFPFEFQDKNLNPYGLDVPPNMLINLDRQGNLIEKGLLGQ
jgi:hypothetical protein